MPANPQYLRAFTIACLAGSRRFEQNGARTSKLGWHTTDTANQIYVHGAFDMTNDNQPTAKPIEERFTIALSELIGMCMEAGMHTAAMIGPLKKELLYVRQASLPTAEDDKYNEERGLAPMTEAAIRKTLQ